MKKTGTESTRLPFLFTYRIIAFFFLLQSFSVWADIEEVSGPLHIEIPPITQEAMESSLRQRERERDDSSDFAIAADTTSDKFPTARDQQSTDPEIADLARALRHNPNLIYQYVHDQIEFEPLYGIKKGAVGALLDKRGNAFDQSALMVALLRASGYTASYVYGKIRPTEKQLISWIGTDSVQAARSVISNGGIPRNGENVTHVWVQVTIDGTEYVFDPSFKQHRVIGPVLDVLAVTGYSQNSFINSALEGAVQTNDYIQNVNNNNIKESLKTYTVNLIDQIKNDHSGASLKDILGGKTIISDKFGLRQTALPHQASVTEIWPDTIPERYQTRLKIQHLGIDVTYSSAAIYGKRLTVRFNDSMQPELRLEGSLVATGDVAGHGPQSINFTITHPYVGGNRSKPQLIEAGPGFTYLVTNGWGKMSKGMLEKHQRLLAKYQQAGQKPGSEAVLGENLMLIASHWIIQNSLTDEITSALAGATTLRHNWVGIAGQNTGPYVDLPLNTSSTISLADGSQRSDVFFSIAGTGSALEHAVIEQSQDIKAVSTVQLLSYANSQSYKIYDLKQANFSAIRPLLLSSYSEKQLKVFQTKIENGSRVLLPENGQLDQDPGDSWKGYAALIISQNQDQDQITHSIGGGLKGAFSRQPFSPKLYKPVPVATRVFDSVKSFATGLVSADPIDLVTGDFLYDHDDLTLGPKALPFGFGFQRHYSSASRTTNGTLGYGWSHGFDITAKKDSNAYQALGEDSPIDAAAAIVASYISLDILQGEKTKEKLMVLALIEKWMTNRLTNNAVNISSPGSTQQFIKLPGDSYNPPPGQLAILSKKADGGYSVRSASGSVMDFNTQGKLQVRKDTNSNVLAFQYNSDGLVESVHNGFNRKITLRYKNKKVSEVEDHTGRQVTYEYDGKGNLVKYTDANCHLTRYVYDIVGRLTQVFSADHPHVPLVTNVYDRRDKVIKQTNGDSHVYHYYFAGHRSEEVDPQKYSKIWYYDDQKSPVRVIDGLRRQTINLYDGQQRLLRKTSPEGNSVRYKYDKFNRLERTEIHPKPGTNQKVLTQTNRYENKFNKLISSTDALTRTTNFHYDERGNLKKIESPAIDGVRPTQEFTYNSRGQVFSVTDAEGRVSHYINDEFADLVKVIADPNGLNRVASFAYDGVGNLVSQTDPKANTTIFKYDNERNLTSSKSPAPFSYITENQYDKNNQLIRTRQQTGDPDQPWQTVSYRYNRSDKVTRIIAPGNRVTDYLYDSNNRLISTTDPEDRITDTQYDAAGQVIDVSQMLGKTRVMVAEQRYNKNGQQKTVTDANGNTTKYSYDGHSRLIATIYPDNTQEKRGYDKAGNVLERFTRANQRFSYQYDALNRLRAKTLPDNSQVQYDYDLTGRRTLVSQEEKDWVNHYDELGQLIETENPAGKIVQYDYDANGNQNVLVYPDGFTVNYEHDPLGRLTAIKQGGAALVKYHYDPLSRKVALDYGNGTRTNYLYNINDDLIVIDANYKTTEGAEQLGKFVYQYNKVGQVTLQNNTLEFSDRLIEPNSKIISSYESNDLNQYQPIDIAVNTPSEGATHTVKTGYDANGNLLSNLSSDYRFEYHYQYNAQNQLVGVKVGYAGNNFADAVSYRYDYDPMGRRTTKRITQKSGNSNRVNALIPDGWKDIGYVYDGNQVLMEEDLQGELLRRYIYGTGIDEPVVMMSRYPGGGDGELQKLYHHFDALGSTRLLTDKDGEQVETYSYGSYGETSVGSQIKTTPYQYTARRYDEETGLYYYRARYYDPVLGRFIQPDPSGYGDGLNLYTYVSNDPINFVDPLGLTRNAISSRVTSIANEFRTTASAAIQTSGVQMTVAGGLGGAVLGGAVATGTTGLVLPSLELGALASGEFPFFGRATKNTKLYRSVSEAELKQIQKTGKFESGPNSLGGKFFAESADDAKKWGDAFGNSRIVETQLPKNVADGLKRWERLDGIGPARYGELNQLRDAIIKEVK